MNHAKRLALGFLIAPLALAGCRSGSDFTGFYNYAHPPKDITGSSRFKIENTDGKYTIVTIVNNKFHQCVPLASDAREAHLATKDELIGLTDQQDNSSVKALIAPGIGYVLYGPKDTLTVGNVHAASGMITNIGGNGIQEAARTKECLPFP